MNCKTTDRWILLSETGELSAREQQLLDEHLAVCTRCARRQAETLGLVAQARDSLPAGVPGERVRATLRAAAAERATHGGLHVLRRPALRLLAYAACLAVALGIWFRVPARAPADPVQETRAILASISEDVYDSRTNESAEDETDELRALARELLIMEGLAADDVGSLDLLWDA